MADRGDQLAVVTGFGSGRAEIGQNQPSQGGYYAITTWLPTFLKTERQLWVLRGKFSVCCGGVFAASPWRTQGPCSKHGPGRLAGN
jgi:hypothetical protein